jgi:hypothetical protein
MNDQYSITLSAVQAGNNDDRSVLAPSPCGEGWGGAHQ